MSLIKDRRDLMGEKIMLVFAVIIPWQLFFSLYGQIDLPVSFLVLLIGFTIVSFFLWTSGKTKVDVIQEVSTQKSAEQC